MTFRYASKIALLACSSLALAAKAAVHSGNIYIYNDYPWFGLQGFEPAAYIAGGSCGGGWGIVVLFPNEAQLQIVSSTIGIGHAWAAVSPGESILPANFNQNAYPWNQISIFSATDGDYWLSYTVENESFVLDPTPDDCYGWLRLHRTGTTLTLVDEAVAEREGGIIAGMRTAIPEPTIPALAGIAGLLVCSSRSRRPQTEWHPENLKCVREYLLEATRAAVEKRK